MRSNGATGISAERVDRLARELAAARRPVMIMGTGSGVPGDEAAVARAAATLTALLGGAAGLLVLGGRSNVQGLVDVGLHPRLLPGHRLMNQTVELEDLTGTGDPLEPGMVGLGLGCGRTRRRLRASSDGC